MRAHFDDFTLDSSTRELLRGNESLHISPKGFELLRRLIEASPRALAKQEILDLVWPGTFVSESTMAAVIAEVRSVLGEALAYILLRIASFGGSLFSTFYGFANIIFGWLLFRSRHIPRVFGVGMTFTGIAFALRTFLLILAPAYASWLLLATAAVAFIPLILWLLIKGVNEEAWRRTVALG